MLCAVVVRIRCFGCGERCVVLYVGAFPEYLKGVMKYDWPCAAEPQAVPSPGCWAGLASSTSQVIDADTQASRATIFNTAHHGRSLLQCQIWVRQPECILAAPQSDIPYSYIEGIVRGYRNALLTSQNYNNLTQCETIDGRPLQVSRDICQNPES